MALQDDGDDVSWRMEGSGMSKKLSSICAILCTLRRLSLWSDWAVVNCLYAVSYISSCVSNRSMGWGVFLGGKCGDLNRILPFGNCCIPGMNVCHLVRNEDSRVSSLGDWDRSKVRECVARATTLDSSLRCAAFGMTGGAALRSEYFMRVVTLTTWNENGVGSSVL